MAKAKEEDAAGDDLFYFFEACYDFCSAIESLKNSAMHHQGANLLGHPCWQARTRLYAVFQFGWEELGAKLQDCFAGLVWA
jgi:hypothetical protein